MTHVSWRRVSYPVNSVVFREGDEGDNAYLIVSGSINIVSNMDGQDRLVHKLNQGEIFGEIALIDRMPRTASAVTAEPCTLIAINSHFFFDKLKNSDPLLAHILGLVVSRFRASNLRQSNPSLATHMIPLHESAVSNILFSQDMSEAIENKEFLVYFQPVVHLSNGNLAGFEALIRWNRKNAGIISPAEFITLAEDTGLIGLLGRWAAEESLRCLTLLQEAMNLHHPFSQPLFISINLSVRQLLIPDELDAIINVIQNSGIDPRRVKLEITESVMIANVEEAIAAMHKLKAVGALLAIDDFGTGYSSLSYLERMPLDNLKIDRSFVLNMRKKENGQRIIRAIVLLAEELGLDCIAEGVETREDELALQQLGCKYAQGYYYSKPVCLETALSYIQSLGDTRH